MFKYFYRYYGLIVFIDQQSIINKAKRVPINKMRCLYQLPNQINNTLIKATLGLPTLTAEIAF